MNLGEPERWATDQAFYSTKMPSVKLIINDTRLKLASQESGRGVIASDSGRLKSGKEREWFKYRGSDVALNISIETVDRGRIYLSKPDYSQKSWGVNFHSSSRSFNGKKYATAILCSKKNGKTAMCKAYGTTFGDDVRFQIFYIEVVSDTWLNKRSDFLSQRERDFISNFNARADSAFSIDCMTDEDMLPKSDETVSITEAIDSTEGVESSQEILKTQFLIKIGNYPFGEYIASEVPAIYRCFGRTSAQAATDLDLIFDNELEKASSQLSKFVNDREAKAFVTGVAESSSQRYIKANYLKFNIDTDPICQKLYDESEGQFKAAKIYHGK